MEELRKIITLISQRQLVKVFLKLKTDVMIRIQ